MNRATTLTHLERLEWITSRLKADEPIVLREIADELGVSLSSINRDIRILRDRGIPIESDRGRGGGIRLCPSWGVGRISLNHREAISLLISLAVTEKMGAQLLTTSFLPIQRKLIASFSKQNQHRIKRLRDRIRVGPSSSIEVLSNYKEVKSPINDSLQEAFLLMDRVLIKYSSGEGKITERTIEPHYLVLNYPIWYVLCWDELRGDVRTFRLDRIKSISKKHIRFSLRPFKEFEIAIEGNDVVVP